MEVEWFALKSGDPGAGVKSAMPDVSLTDSTLQAVAAFQCPTSDPSRDETPRSVWYTREMPRRYTPRVPPTTTIKVPRELRDRLSKVAQQERTTLASVIARLLDAAEEQAFWEAVRNAHAGIAEDERVRRVPDATLTDDLADQVDDALSAADDW